MAEPAIRSSQKVLRCDTVNGNNTHMFAHFEDGKFDRLEVRIPALDSRASSFTLSNLRDVNDFLAVAAKIKEELDAHDSHRL